MSTVMKLFSLPVESIIVANSSRKDFGDIETLAGSIKSLGMLHPIVVNSDNELICGERRLLAVKKLGWKTVPTHVANDLDDACLAIQAQRDENTCRKDFTPSEGVKMTERIEAAYSVKAKAAKASAPEGKRTGRPKKSDTENCRKTSSPRDRKEEEKRTTGAVAAAVTGKSRRTHEKAKAIVKAAEAEPEKFAPLVKHMDETGKVDAAFNKLKAAKKQEALEVKAAAVEFSAEQPLWTLIHQDVLDGLQSVLDHHSPARLIFADPPYNIGIDYGDGGQADRQDPGDYLDWVSQWIAKCWDVLTDDGSLWVMICDEYAAHYHRAISRNGFTIRSWIKWYETFGVNCSNNFNRCSRHIFYAVKDPKQFVFNVGTLGDAGSVLRDSDRHAKYNDKRAVPGGKIWDDVWQIPRLAGTCEERMPDFPTQLPLALLEPIVCCASDPGDLVVDPFSGSATTGVAAIKHKRKYVGIDKSERFISLSEKRLKVCQ